MKVNVIKQALAHYKFKMWIMDNPIDVVMATLKDTGYVEHEADGAIVYTKGDITLKITNTRNKR